MGLTIVQQILSRATGNPMPRPGDILIATVDVVMISEALGPKFFDHEIQALGDHVFDPEKVVVIVDHYSPAATINQAEFNRFTQDWADRHGISHFYMHCGPNPQVMAEQGFYQPGTVVVGNDSHTCSGGAFGTLAVGVGSTAIACAAATGKVWMKVPETIKIKWEGELPGWVSGKDMALFMIGTFGSNRLIYKALEFDGSCIKALSMDDRMVLSNLAVEMGAKAGMIAPDQRTRETVQFRSEYGTWDLTPDVDAPYEEELQFDAGKLEPMIAVPHHVSNIKLVREVNRVPIDQAFIGSCTGGRYEDLKAALRVLKGRRVDRKVRLIISPASKWIWERAAREGILSDLSEAGAVISYPSCGPCGGAQGGLLAAGEICVSASNRNFKGRMGSTEAEVYLASAATVAASAVTGKITDPRNMARGKG
jgi:3-isopropylmalate/(R)-2-methylmalate dehydratase large subunit